MMLRYVLLGTCLAGVLSMSNGCSSTEQGRFVRTVWAPLNSNRFRVNSPDTATGRYADRWEAQQTGLLTLAIDEDPSTVAAADLYLELWGGHPGVANKRVAVNGRTEHVLPEVGAAEKNCTYSYPAIPLNPADLKAGANEFQFTCERGSTFWGHYLLCQAAVRLTLPADHPSIVAAGLTAFTASVRTRVEGETVHLSLNVPAPFVGRIAGVEYWGRYDGYDEDGDGVTDDWHGFTKNRKPVAILGVATGGGFPAAWDTSMVPDQAAAEVRAIVRFADPADLAYETAGAAVGLPARPASVTLHSVSEIDRPFWSRDNKVRKARIDLPMDPSEIERAQLHVAIWDGGSGGVQDHFTINGHAVPIAGEGHHDLLYRVVRIDPGILREGANEIRLLSSTKHHGIEVALPGPAFVVRRPAR